MDSRPTSSLPTDIYGLIIRFLDVGDIIVLRQVSTIVQGMNYYLANPKLIKIVRLAKNSTNYRRFEVSGIDSCIMMYCTRTSLSRKCRESLSNQ